MIDDLGVSEAKDNLLLFNESEVLSNLYGLGNFTLKGVVFGNFMILTSVDLTLLVLYLFIILYGGPIRRRRRQK